MIKSKITLSLVSLFFAFHANAQLDKIFSLKIFDYIGELDKKIDSFFDSEKANALYRNVTYLQNDLTQYLIIRKGVTDTLKKTQYSSFSKTWLESRLKTLRGEFHNIDVRFYEINRTVEIKYSSVGIENSELDRTKDAIASQKEMFFTKLSELVSGNNVDKAKLELEANTIYKQLKDSIKMLTALKIKLEQKFDL